MDYTTIFGALAGVFLIVAAIMSGSDGGLAQFFNLPSIFIVVGGTFSATMIAFPSRELAMIREILGTAFMNPRTEVNQIIRFITSCQERLRSGGHLAMEQMSRKARWQPMRLGLQLIADGADNDTIREILTIEQRAIEEHHRIGQRIFSDMGKFSPAFGMLGTLVGLVKMLASLDDPSAIGPKMAIALLTTFYGVLMANLVFIPLVTKLERRSHIEVLQIKLMIVGLTSINKNDTLLITREKMGAFLAKEASGTALDRRSGRSGYGGANRRRR